MAIYVPTEFFEQINKMLFLPQCGMVKVNIMVNILYRELNFFKETLTYQKDHYFQNY